MQIQLTDNLWQIPESVLVRPMDGETLVVHLDSGALFYCDASAQAFFDFFRTAHRLTDYLPGSDATNWESWMEFLQRESLIERVSAAAAQSRPHPAEASVPRFLRPAESGLRLNAVSLATTDTNTSS